MSIDDSITTTYASHDEFSILYTALRPNVLLILFRFVLQLTTGDRVLSLCTIPGLRLYCR